MEFFEVNPADIKHDLALLEREALDATGRLKVMPSAFYRDIAQGALSVFCVKHGHYALPTHELLDIINQKIMEVSPSRNALEIGSGNGTLGAGLGITCTDNFQQDTPELQRYYAQIQQATVKYGDHVKRLPALDAVDYYKPEVVVAAWVTHKWNPAEPHRKGNEAGVDEKILLSKIKRYIFVGNGRPHQDKPLLEVPHQTLQGDYLFSRGRVPEECALWIWDN